MNERTGSWVSLCGVTMSGTLVPNDGLKFTDLEGWWGLPPARGRPDSIPGQHGQYRRTKALRESRAITLTGEIRASNNRDLQHARDRLEAALAAGAGEMILFTEAGGQWQRFVEIDTLDIAPDHGRSWTGFTVDMVAPEPRRYGPRKTIGPVGLPRVSGGVLLPQALPWDFGTVDGDDRLFVPNGGGIPLAPTFRLTGAGFSQFAIIDTTAGRRISLTWPITGVEPVVIDSARRRVMWGQTDLTRWLSYRQWFEIPAGDTHEFRFEVSGTSGEPKLWADFQEGAW